ncbi:MAG TPA: L,D-transpeptidase [Kofleriaceae bacterium]
MRSWQCALVALLPLVACRGKQDSPPASQAAPDHADEPGEAAAPATPEFPDGTHSLVLTRTVGVRYEPGDDAKRIGTVAIDTRVGWAGHDQPGKGCTKPWIEIEPRGWICGDYVVATKKEPYGQEVPHLDRGEIVPGVYGKITAAGAMTYLLTKHSKRPRHDAPPDLIEDAPVIGSVNVRRYDELDIAGRTYWKIAQKDAEYVLRSAITLHQPSRFEGTRLGDDIGWSVPIAFVWPRGGGPTAYVLDKSTGGGIAREIAARTAVPILETAAGKDGKPTAYRIGDGEWMFPPDLRVFTPEAPPATLAANERWIDVDLDAQILVAYEGTLPVYATLVSTGGKETPTETGLYRVWMKESEADMKGLNGEDPYSVATVPWTQYFYPERDLALHTAYWHDQFGHARSHGCVNLAPRDARWLYFWSDPQVPPGWTMSAGVVEAPGSVVRIRSAAEPNPEWKGYAKRVVEARQAVAP